MISSTAQPRADLNLVVQGHVSNSTQFVQNRVFPVRTVEKKTGRYWKIKPGTLLRAPTTKRAPGAKYPRDTYDLEDGTYSLEGKGLEGQVAVEHQTEFSGIVDLEQARAMQKVNQILRREEVDLAGTLFNQTTFPVAAATGFDETNEWDDHTNATPIDTALMADNAIRNNIGDYKAMGLQFCALMNWRTRRHLALCNQVRTGLGGVYTRPEFANADIPDAMLAQVIGVDEIIVADPRYQSAGTVAAPTVSNIWSDEFCLFFVRADPSAPEFMGLGLTLVWNEFGGEFEVSTYDEEQTSSRVVQVDRTSQQLVVQTGAAFLVGNLKS